jgi:hypothetical protein
MRSLAPAIMLAIALAGGGATAHANPTQYSEPVIATGQADYSEMTDPEQEEALPADLADALERDLGISPTQYFESAEAAERAAALAEELAGEGIELADVAVTDANAITVEVDTKAQAKAVLHAGAKPVAAGAVKPAEAPPAPTVRPLAREIAPGAKYHTGQYSACTLAFWGYDTHNDRVALSAGHCNRAGGTTTEMRVDNPWDGEWESGSTFGRFGVGRYGGGFDATLIHAEGDTEATATVKTWGQAKTVRIKGQIAPVVGTKVCKSGGRTGWTCGRITAPPQQFVVSDVGNPLVSGFATDMCSASGDSGAPVMAGSYAVGVLSFGSFTVNEGDDASACSMEEQVRRYLAGSMVGLNAEQEAVVRRTLAEEPHRMILTGVHPIEGDAESVSALFGDGFRLAVHVPKPTKVRAVVKKKSTVVKGQIALGGRVAGDYQVRVKAKGKTHVVKVAQSGRFKVSLKKVGKKSKVKVYTVLVQDKAQKSAKVTKRAR